MRKNLDPFKQHTDEELWNALQEVLQRGSQRFPITAPWEDPWAPPPPHTMRPFRLPARHKAWGEIPLVPWGPALCGACNWEPLKSAGEMFLAASVSGDEGFTPAERDSGSCLLPLNGFDGPD